MNEHELQGFDKRVKEYADKGIELLKEIEPVLNYAKAGKAELEGGRLTFRYFDMLVVIQVELKCKAPNDVDASICGDEHYENDEVEPTRLFEYHFDKLGNIIDSPDGTKRIDTEQLPRFVIDAIFNRNFKLHP